MGAQPSPQKPSQLRCKLLLNSERSGLQNQRYQELQLQARSCKKRCHGKTKADDDDKQLICQVEMAVECDSFCMSEIALDKGPMLGEG
jgi:hypothetical protein